MKNDKDYKKNGYRCIFCGHELLWSSQETASEIIDDYEDDDFASV